MPAIRPRSEATALARGSHRLSREAGHAVVAYLRSRSFTSISIVANRETLGQSVFGNEPVTALGTGSRGRRRDRVETLIMVSLAGMLAECWLTGHRNWRGAHANLHDATAY